MHADQGIDRTQRPKAERPQALSPKRGPIFWAMGKPRENACPFE